MPINFCHIPEYFLNKVFEFITTSKFKLTDKLVGCNYISLGRTKIQDESLTIIKIQTECGRYPSKKLKQSVN
ncbi:hypothetical protein C9J03_14700 [Photobacterium gaetbulicola]|nr:hypothetical protein C9J03_14700 [Photobacterium gaetbulicola]